MVKVISKLLVPVSVVLIFVGMLFPSARDIFIISGLALLVIAWLIERIALDRYRPISVEFLDCERVELAFSYSSNLVITDNWSLTNSVTLGVFEGDYRAEIVRVRRGSCVFIDAIRFFRLETLGKASSIRKSNVSVDSGWLLFLDETYANEISLREYSNDVSKHLASLSAAEPLCRWLRSEDQNVVGIVIATGDGDGEYLVNYTKVDGIVIEAVVDFGVT